MAQQSTKSFGPRNLESYPGPWNISILVLVPGGMMLAIKYYFFLAFLIVKLMCVR